MPKSITPNLHAFIRSTRSSRTARETPVSLLDGRVDLDALDQGRSAQRASKSLRGLT